MEFKKSTSKVLSGVIFALFMAIICLVAVGCASVPSSGSSGGGSGGGTGGDNTNVVYPIVGILWEADYSVEVNAGTPQTNQMRVYDDENNVWIFRKTIKIQDGDFQEHTTVDGATSGVIGNVTLLNNNKFSANVLRFVEDIDKTLIYVGEEEWSYVLLDNNTVLKITNRVFNGSLTIVSNDNTTNVIPNITVRYIGDGSSIIEEVYNIAAE